MCNKAKVDEQKYKQFNPSDNDVSLVADFNKRNKGKRFKLQFIRKACHLMCFRDSYLRNVKQYGHHKGFHITKDEFNDYCKWMFAFDETPIYKVLLTDLFKAKGFLNNSDFKKLFEYSSSLEVMYEKTKKIYSDWLKTFSPIAREGKYTLEGYEKFFKDDMFYINISHFINFMKNDKKIRTEKGIIQYHSLSNLDYLIDGFYYTQMLDKSEYKTCGKLYNKLKTAKLEDALLYELAMYYLKFDETITRNARTHVVNLLTQDIIFRIENANQKYLMSLSVPFNKIDNYVELLEFKKEQENDPKYKKTSFMSNLPDYIENILSKEKKDNKELEAICKSYKEKQRLNYDELNKINNHIISTSSLFTKVLMNLEEYFIFKNANLIVRENRIFFEDIAGINNFLSDIYERNRAFHFGLPKKSYIESINRIEKKFIIEEARPLPNSYDDFPNPIKSVLNALLETIHNDLFERKNKDQGKKRKEAGNKYFEKFIDKK